MGRPTFPPACVRPVHPVGERSKLQAPAFLEMKLTGGPPRTARTTHGRTDGTGKVKRGGGKNPAQSGSRARSAGGNEASVGGNNETVLKRSRSHLGLIICQGRGLLPSFRPGILEALFNSNLLSTVEFLHLDGRRIGRRLLRQVSPPRFAPTRSPSLGSHDDRLTAADWIGPPIIYLCLFWKKGFPALYLDCLLDVFLW